MVNVILCGFRNWASDIFDLISKNENLNILMRIESIEKYQENEALFENFKIDVILFIGWSWIIPSSVTDKFLCVGIHPSDLPNFRGGSPIQNQIIRGIIKTKITLFSLSSQKLDAGDIWMKEDVELNGNNADLIFDNIVISSVKLLNNFFNLYPKIYPIEQDINSVSYFKRRKPEESRLAIEDFQIKSLSELYNFIRCLTDPYPNAFLEDKDGNRLLFTGIKYLPVERKNSDEH